MLKDVDLLLAGEAGMLKHRAGSWKHGHRVDARSLGIDVLRGVGLSNSEPAHLWKKLQPWPRTTASVAVTLVSQVGSGGRTRESAAPRGVL